MAKKDRIEFVCSECGGTTAITDIPEADVGSKVELWGRHIAVNDLARRCGTIGYELLCALARRVPLVLKG